MSGISFKNWVISKIPSGALVYYALCFLPLAFVLYLIGDLVVPLILSVIVAYVIRSVASSINTHIGRPRLSMAISAGATIGLVSFLLILIMPMVFEQAVNLMREMPKIYAQSKTFALDMVQSLSGEHAKQLTSIVNESFSQFSTVLFKSTGVVINTSLASVLSLFDILLYAVLLPILVFFLVRDAKSFVAFGGRFLNPGQKRVVSDYWPSIDSQLGSYIKGKVLEMIVVGVVSYIAFLMMDLNYALLLAVAVGISVMVPFVGAFIVSIPVVAVILNQFPAGATPYIYIGVYFLIQILDGNVLVPMIFSDVMKLHPLAIILAVLICGAIAGVWGMFFAIPLLAIAKIIVDRKYPLQEA